KKSDGVWTEIEAASPGDPIGQLYGFVEKAAKFIAEDERGCDLANAAVELTEEGHPGLRVIEEFKVRQRDRLARLCGAAGASRPELLRSTRVLGRSATPSVTEGARYSFSPSRLCPLEIEQKAGVRNGKPDFSLRNQCCRRGCTSRRNPPSPSLGSCRILGLSRWPLPPRSGLATLGNRWSASRQRSFQQASFLGHPVGKIRQRAPRQLVRNRFFMAFSFRSAGGHCGHRAPVGQQSANPSQSLWAVAEFF